MNPIQLQCADLLVILDASRARVGTLARRDAHGDWIPVLRVDPRPDPRGEWRGALRPVLASRAATGAWAVHDRSPASARLRLERDASIVAFFRVEVTPGAVRVDLDADPDDAPRLEMALMRAHTSPGDALRLAPPESDGARTRLVASWERSALTMHLDVSGAARTPTVDASHPRWTLLTLAQGDEKHALRGTHAAMRFSES